MLERLDPIVIAVRDVAAATRRSARLLGRMPSWTSETPAAGARSTIFELGNAALTLVEPCGEGPIASPCRARLEAHGEGLCALVLRSHAPDDDLARLAARDIEPGAHETILEHDDPSGAWRQLVLHALPIGATGGLPLLLAAGQSETEIRPPSAYLAEEAACVDRLDHVVVTTNRPERARALYGEALGLRLALDRRFEERGLRLLFFRLGGATLEIAARTDTPESEATKGSESDAFYGLAHHVADIEGAHERLAKAGFGSSPIRNGHKPGTRVFTLDAEETHGIPTLFVSENGSG